jgi:ribosomal protein S18 acetylase RimI-like enzyme
MIEDGFVLPADAAFALIESVYAESDAFAGNFTEEYPSLAAFSAYLSEIRARPGSLFLIARAAGQPTGFLFITPRTPAKLRHTADLSMGVRRAARGRRVGSRLLGEALARLGTQGDIEIVYLMVRADNAAGMRLYQSYGFEPLATLARDTKIGNDYYDGVLMKRAIQQRAVPPLRDGLS